MFRSLRQATTLYAKANSFSTRPAVTKTQPPLRDTICALSSAPGRASVAVIRLSGPETNRVLQFLLPPKQDAPPPRVATVAKLYKPKTQQLLDQALLLRFPGPKSFTGEDVLEVHCHGGPATIKILLETLISFPGVRLADAGEFTKRALQAGKLDVSEVEGLSDLLAADTAAQHHQAIQQAGGRQRAVFEAWQRTLTSCLASVEAVIDFGEDEQLGDHVLASVRPRVQSLRDEINSELANGNRGELVREGVHVAILGPPNAGKSTLLNALAGREAAIVSSIAGTTRDTVQVSLDLGGHKVVLVDTAGLHETKDLVEGLGIQRSLQAAASAQLIVWMADASHPATANILHQHEHAAKMPWPQKPLLEQLLNASAAARSPSLSMLCASLCNKPTLFVANKLDVASGSSSELNSSLPCSERSAGQSNTGPASPTSFHDHPTAGLPDGEVRPSASSAAGSPNLKVGQDSRHASAADSTGWSAARPEANAARDGMDKRPDRIQWVSCHTGEGLQSLEQHLERAVAHVINGDNPQLAPPLMTRARHREALRKCSLALDSYDLCCNQPELAAEAMRSAAASLKPLTGGVSTEAVLDALFAEFCIGK